MLNEIDIERIFESKVAPIIKGVHNGQYRRQKNKMPEYYDGYRKFVGWRDRIRVHAEMGVFPEELLSNRAPNATPDEWKYVKDNYKEITLPLSIDYQSTVGRAWSENNWSISYKDNEQDFGEDTLKKYVEMDVVHTPLKMSLEDYFKTVFQYVKMIDSMGCIAVKPHSLEYVMDEESETMVLSGDLIEPIPYYYSSEQLVAFEEDEYYMFEMKEKTVVEYGGKQQRMGYMYEVYDKNAIWHIKQIGKYVDWKFEIELYYEHGREKIPVSYCKGKPVMHNNNIVWESRFLSAVPLLDEVILDAVYLRAVKNLSAFPYRVMTGETCNGTMEIEGEIQHCNGNGWYYDHNTGKRIHCETCDGTGMKDRVSPYGVMLLRPESPQNEAEGKAHQPAIYYVAPKIDTPEFLRREIEDNYNYAAQMLHLYTSATELAKGTEEVTATQKALDMKSLYAFVKQDSEQTFGTYEWTLGWINYMRYKDDRRDAFTITYPQSFDFYTDYDYLMQVSEAIKNGLPPFLVQATVLRYIKSLFNNDLISSKAYDLMIDTDRLMTMTKDEIMEKSAKNLVENWEIVLHDSGVNFIFQLYENDKEFFEQDRDKQKEQLIEMAKLKADQANENANSINEQIIRLSNGLAGTDNTGQGTTA